MVDTVVLQIPSKVREILNRTPEEMAYDMRLYAALMLYNLGKLSAGAAAEMAGIPKVMFLDLCAEYGLRTSQSTPDELRAEILN